MPSKRNRRNRRKAKQRLKMRAEISYDETPPLPLPVLGPPPRMTSAERIFKMCQTRLQRKSKTRNLRLKAECGRVHNRVKFRGCVENGETIAFRRDRIAQVPYARDYYGPKQRKERKDRKVTHGECTPIAPTEHYFDDAALYEVPMR